MILRLISMLFRASILIVIIQAIFLYMKISDFVTRLLDMGGSGSKSVFDRRNSVERRTQRRHLHNYKMKIDQLTRQVDGLGDKASAETVDQIKQQLLALKAEMPKKCAHLQNKNKPLFDSLFKRVDELLQKMTVVHKLEELTIEEKSPVEMRKNENAKTHHNNNNNVQKVDFKIVQLSPVDDRISIKSRASSVDRRESILKLGVPVMPNVAHELPNKIANARRVSHQQLKTDALDTIEQIKLSVSELELKVNDFIGRKNGRHYTRLRKDLERNLQLLWRIDDIDGDIIEQKELCKRYICNCLSFLDEKAINYAGSESDGSNDEVFLPVQEIKITPKPMVATFI